MEENGKFDILVLDSYGDEYYDKMEEIENLSKRLNKKYNA